MENFRIISKKKERKKKKKKTNTHIHQKQVKQLGARPYLSTQAILKET